MNGNTHTIKRLITGLVLATALAALTVPSALAGSNSRYGPLNPWALKYFAPQTNTTTAVIDGRSPDTRDAAQAAQAGLLIAADGRSAVAGLAAGIFVSGGGASSRASHATSHSKATTHVTVTATDSKFTLSKRSAPIGTVIFTVTNKGKISHDFKIAGKKTPLLAPGHSATLRVTFSKKGRYPYLSTVSGQAAAGMKGVFSVAAAVAPTPTPAPTPPTPPRRPDTHRPAGRYGQHDGHRRNVRHLGQPRFVLSQKTIPSGMVTFVITNHCVDHCSFDLEGIKAGALLNPGQSETWTVALAPGSLPLPLRRAPDLMKGSFTVTP